jgi:polyhydroxyalkanoate synthesis regulator phasin
MKSKTTNVNKDKMEENMDPKQIAKQMVDFNKTAFNNSFDAMSVIQDQAEKMINAMMEQTAFFPEEGKKTVTDWLKTCKKGREEFKASADENIKVKDFISFKKVAAFYRSDFLANLQFQNWRAACPWFILTHTISISKDNEAARRRLRRRI